MEYKELVDKIDKLIDKQELSISPFQKFKEASNTILDQGRHTDDEDIKDNQLNKKEND